MEGSSYR